MSLPLAATLGFAAGGAGSLIGGIGNLLHGSSVQQQQNWQENMMAKQQQYWKEQFDLVNEYNHPKNVVQRYLQAGISPSAGFGSSSVGQSSASPVLGGSGSPVGFPPTMQNGAQIFSTIAQAVSSLGSAFKNTAEGKSIMTLLADQLRGLKLDNDQKQFLFNLDQANLPKKQKIEIGNLFAEGQKLTAQANLANEEELLTIEKRYKTIAERLSEITKNSLLQKDLANYDANFNSILENRRSQNAANYASAAESRENAMTVRDMRQWSVLFQKSTAELREVDSFVERNNQWKRCEARLAELRAQEMLPARVEEEIRNARKRNDWYEVNELLGIVDEGVRAAGTYYGARTGKGLVDAQNVRNSIDKEYRDWQMNKPGYQPRTYTPRAPWENYGR